MSVQDFLEDYKNNLTHVLVLFSDIYSHYVKYKYKHDADANILQKTAFAKELYKLDIAERKIIGRKTFVSLKIKNDLKNMSNINIDLIFKKLNIE
jgi:hypothetical protein